MDPISVANSLINRHLLLLRMDSHLSDLSPVHWTEHRGQHAAPLDRELQLKARSGISGPRGRAELGLA